MDKRIVLLKQIDPHIYQNKIHQICHKHINISFCFGFRLLSKWTQLLNSGISQADIARSEGMTRARVCQLIRLNQLDKKTKRQIRRRDE